MGKLMNASNNGFWSGRRVLLTGHSGFKGGWLAIWLNHLNANIAGISLPPSTNPSLFKLAKVEELCAISCLADLREKKSIEALVEDFKPEIVFHLAAQPLVRASYKNPVETFETNIQGTVNVLEALRKCESVRVAVMITTDKVYRNHEVDYLYSENDALGGADPYSASKAACEIVIEAYRQSFFRKQGVALGSARAGNVIGGGDWSEDRLIPDAVRAWLSNQHLEIRRPNAVRPWQHVLDPLAGYLNFAEALWNKRVTADAYNFGPLETDSATVQEVIEIAREIFGRGDVLYHNEASGPHEAGLLRLNSAKARKEIGYSSKLNLHAALRNTIQWYQQLEIGRDARSLCEAEILEYCKT